MEPLERESGLLLLLRSEMVLKLRLETQTSRPPLPHPSQHRCLVPSQGLNSAGSVQVRRQEKLFYGCAVESNVGHRAEQHAVQPQKLKLKDVLHNRRKPTHERGQVNF